MRRKHTRRVFPCKIAYVRTGVRCTHVQRKRSNGTWEARITVGTDPMTGKLISKSVYGRTQKDCRQKLKALQDKLEGRSSKTAAFVENAAAELEAEKERR